MYFGQKYFLNREAQNEQEWGGGDLPKCVNFKVHFFPDREHMFIPQQNKGKFLTKCEMRLLSCDVV